MIATELIKVLYLPPTSAVSSPFLLRQQLRQRLKWNKNRIKVLKKYKKYFGKSTEVDLL